MNFIAPLPHWLIASLTNSASMQAEQIIQPEVPNRRAGWWRGDRGWAQFGVRTVEEPFDVVGHQLAMGALGRVGGCAGGQQ